ncbi:hypothetical protein [Streptomyces rimosus]|uniref:hypothetical protein n=1 Tax=Streptomyces rimosus TaxID=1927 RepID=UPI00067A8556|nr:hypothetical protein [Streptomyces rimosus]
MLRSKPRSLLIGLAAAAAMLGTTQATATASEAPASKDASAAYWSCTVPRGYTYNHVMNTTTCSTSGISLLYHVMKPKTGLWACTVPRGFTYTASHPTTACSTRELSTLYLLRKT